MSRGDQIEEVWWRQVQLGEFYNIERYPKISGGGGSLYIEVPSSMKEKTLRFLGLSSSESDHVLPYEIEARVITDPSVRAPIIFDTKSGGRLRIVNQNRQQPSCERHPAWTCRYGFPKAPDSIADREEAAPFFPEGGLRIYIARSVSHIFYAGFTKGFLPKGMDQNDPNSRLYEEGKVGGVFSCLEVVNNGRY